MADEQGNLNEENEQVIEEVNEQENKTTEEPINQSSEGNTKVATTES